MRVPFLLLLPLLLLAVVANFPVTTAVKWLAMHAVNASWSTSKECPRNTAARKQLGMVAYQSKLCRRINDLMPILVRAAKATVYSCQDVFETSRWNCSSVLEAPNLTAELLRGSREQAFVYALSSAAITHQVAKACVSGQLPYCPCGVTSSPNPPIDDDASHKWKGCSDNVLYGQMVSREWADAPWKRRPKKNNTVTAGGGRWGRDADVDDFSLLNEDGLFDADKQRLSARARMNQHNNDVGRLVTQQSLFLKCKCHGVSSSCSVRTCWHTLPPLSEIAEKLKKLYDEAYDIQSIRASIPGIPGINSYSATIPPEIIPQTLVYIRKSPDYCERDRYVGSYGTHYRECNGSTSAVGPFACSHMCCGRGHSTTQVRIQEQCRCKYVHCCYVKCETCTYLLDKHQCL